MTESDALLHLKELLEQQTRAMQTLLEAQIKTLAGITDEKFSAIKEATAVAASVLKEHLLILNEFRAMISEWRGTFEPIGGVNALKSRVDEAMEGMKKTYDGKLDAVKENVAKLEQGRANQTGRISTTTAFIGSGIGIGLVILNIIASYFIQRMVN